MSIWRSLSRRPAAACGMRDVSFGLLMSLTIREAAAHRRGSAPAGPSPCRRRNAWTCQANSGWPADDGRVPRQGRGWDAARAAADAEIAHAEIIGRLAELGDLVAIAGEGIQRHGEGMIVRDAIAMPVPQRLEGGLLGCGAVGNGQGRHVAFNLAPNPLEERKHGARPATAIEPDDIHPGLLEAPARLLRAPVLARDAVRMDGEGDHRRQLRRLDGFERDERLAAMGIGLADDEVDAGIDGPLHLLVEHLAHGLVGRLVVRRIGRGVADIAGDQRAGVLRHLLGDLERQPVHRLEVLLAADEAQLRAMAVIGEGLYNVGSRMHEFAVKLLDELGMLEHDLGDIGAGLEIAAPLELEEVAFGTDDGALFQAIEQSGPAIRLGGVLALHDAPLFKW